MGKEKLKEVKKKPTIKYIIIGDSSVGSTSLINKYCLNKFEEKPINSEEEEEIRNIKYENEEIEIRVCHYNLDITTVTAKPFRGAKCFIFLYDSSNKTSLEYVSSINCYLKMCDTVNPLCVYIGNKCDLNKEITIDEVKQKCGNNNDILFYEVSCKTGEGIEDTFNELNKIIIERFDIVPKVQQTQQQSTKNNKKCILQ